MTLVVVTFRGEPTDIIVDSYTEDPETNACEVEWHFDGVTSEERDDLRMTDDEEDAVVQQIHVIMYERDDG